MKKNNGEFKPDYVDEYGQPVDKYGRPLDENGVPYQEEDADTVLEQKTGSFETIPEQPARGGQRKSNAYHGYDDYDDAPRKKKSKRRSGGVPSAPSVPKGGKRRRKKKHGILHKLVVLILILCIAAAADIAYLLTLYNYDDTNASSIRATDGIMNVALFGVDADDGTGVRSDAIMIMSAGSKQGKLKTVSLMRDSLVEVPDHGKTKLTHAYSYGGAQLAVQTISQDFQVDLNEYITVDFTQMSAIIDAVGGVTIDVQEDELEELNNVIANYIFDGGREVAKVESAGVQKLNGDQAVCYGRIRYNTGGDWSRTERQSQILEALFSEIGHNPIKMLKFVHGLMPNITSSLSKSDFIKLGLRTVMHGIPKMEHTRLPLDGEWDYRDVDGMSVITFSDAKLAEHLHDYLYNDVMPTVD